MSLLSSHQLWQINRIKILNSQEFLVTAAVLRDTIKGTLCTQLRKLTTRLQMREYFLGLPENHNCLWNRTQETNISRFSDRSEGHQVSSGNCI